MIEQKKYQVIEKQGSLTDYEDLSVTPRLECVAAQVIPKYILFN